MTFGEWYDTQRSDVDDTVDNPTYTKVEYLLRTAWQAGYMEGAKNIVLLEEALDRLNAQLLATKV